MYSDILLCVDFDRTLTAMDGSIPQRNLEAIRHFIAGGGSFTVNTGRSYVSFLPFLDIVPINAPLLLMNGSGSWENGKFEDIVALETDVWPIVQRLEQEFPGVHLELQTLDKHYLIHPTADYARYYQQRGLAHEVADPQIHWGPFVKIGIYGDTEHREEGSEAVTKAALFDEIEQILRRELDDSLVVLRATPQIINVHAKGASKLTAARNLQKKLGKKILVCIGDEGNDVAMLQGADFAFCPSDGAVAADFPNVCPCSQGAVADVIYNEIPKILRG
jgi:HAD superfamily hydrolase (TIGR01484 family)